MSELIRERAQYTKGKTPIIIKYLVDHKQLFNEIAGRGFLNLPGYAYDAENSIEMAAKMGLSELNYKIMAETIERELKQTGIDYDQLYKDAIMAWEVEKQDLIEDWDHELAGIKQGMAEEEEVKERLGLEVDARQSVLITAKTAIELEMEGYRTTLAGLDGATAPYEVSLANAKLLTAQKKLDLIPIIQEIITKETELLGLESNKTAEYTKLMNAEQAVATKKQQLIPGMAELATVMQEHASLIPSQISIEGDIANEKLEQATIAVELAENKVEEINAEIDAETTRLELSGAQRDLKDLQFDHAQNLIKSEIDKDTEYQNALADSIDTMMDGDRQTAAKLLSDKEALNDIKNDTEYESTKTLEEAQASAVSNKTTADIFKIEEETALKIANQITATLTHLIGQ
jgi:hypothetical protein